MEVFNLSSKSRAAPVAFLTLSKDDDPSSSSWMTLLWMEIKINIIRSARKDQTQNKENAETKCGNQMRNVDLYKSVSKICYVDVIWQDEWVIWRFWKVGMIYIYKCLWQLRCRRPQWFVLFYYVHLYFSSLHFPNFRVSRMLKYSV